MKVLILDTETTGFSPVNEYIVQLAYLIYDTNTNNIEQTNFYIEPPIQILNSHIHHITNEFVKNSYTFSDIAQIFLDDLEAIDLLVGHNIKFDLDFLKEELRRAKITTSRLDDIQTYDTMKNSVNVCRIKNQYGSFKYPKLNELYQHFFKKDFNNQHNAIGDITATLACYKRLICL